MIKLLTLVTALMLSFSVLADELRGGRLNSNSQGAISLSLNLLSYGQESIRFVRETEVVSNLVPEFLASALLASRTVSFGVCPPDIYSDGFALSVPADIGLAAAQSNLQANWIDVRLNSLSLESIQQNNRALTVSACANTPGAEVVLTLRRNENLLSSRVILGKFILLVKPE